MLHVSIFQSRRPGIINHFLWWYTNTIFHTEYCLIQSLPGWTGTGFTLHLSPSPPPPPLTQIDVARVSARAYMYTNRPVHTISAMKDPSSAGQSSSTSTQTIYCYCHIAKSIIGPSIARTTSNRATERRRKEFLLTSRTNPEPHHCLPTSAQPPSSVHDI